MVSIPRRGHLMSGLGDKRISSRSQEYKSQSSEENDGGRTHEVIISNNGTLLPQSLEGVIWCPDRAKEYDDYTINMFQSPRRGHCAFEPGTTKQSS